MSDLAGENSKKDTQIARLAVQVANEMHARNEEKQAREKSIALVRGNASGSKKCCASPEITAEDLGLFVYQESQREIVDLPT